MVTANPSMIIGPIRVLKNVMQSRFITRLRLHMLSWVYAYTADI